MNILNDLIFPSVYRCFERLTRQLRMLYLLCMVRKMKELKSEYTRNRNAMKVSTSKVFEELSIQNKILRRLIDNLVQENFNKQINNTVRERKQKSV